MTKVPFNENEFDICGQIKSGTVMFRMNAGATNVPLTEPVYNRPITDKENWRLWFDPEASPYWLPFGGWLNNDITIFRPRMNPDNYATHLVFDGEELFDYTEPLEEKGNFGLTWVYVPVAGGATVKPGKPVLEDMNDWRDAITMPDLDSWDWEGASAANKEYLNNPRMNQLGILNGFWERMMSLMDVDNAAIALVDEDQEEALIDFLTVYSDFIVDYIRRCKKYFDIDNVLIHDDWGHQKAGFFSLETARKFFVPYLKKITDTVHELGMTFELHSCGLNEALVPALIEAGVDLWCPQPINDVLKLAETYKDAPITFGSQFFPCPDGASVEEQKQAARDWFEKIKDLKIINACRTTPPEAVKELYRLSRAYYLNK